MSDLSNDPDRRRLRNRFNDTVRTDADEIQDWINASGGMVLAAILIGVGIYAFVVLVF